MNTVKFIAEILALGSASLSLVGAIKVRRKAKADAINGLLSSTVQLVRLVCSIGPEMERVIATSQAAQAARSAKSHDGEYVSIVQ
jgi:hypothetical protein